MWFDCDHFENNSPWSNLQGYQFLAFAPKYLILTFKEFKGYIFWNEARSTADELLNQELNSTDKNIKWKDYFLLGVWHKWSWAVLLREGIYSYQLLECEDCSAMDTLMPHEYCSVRCMLFSQPNLKYISNKCEVFVCEWSVSSMPVYCLWQYHFSLRGRQVVQWPTRHIVFLNFYLFIEVWLILKLC